MQSPFQLLQDRNSENVPSGIEMVLGEETLGDILQESAGEVKSLTGALRL